MARPLARALATILEPRFMPGPGSFLIGEEEERELLEVMRSGHLYRYGDPDDPNFKRKVMTLEEEFAQSIGVRHALAVNSGTAAVWISMLSQGIGEGDVDSISFAQGKQRFSQREGGRCEDRAA